MFPDRSLIGWLDERHLLVQQFTEGFDSKTHKWIKWEGKLRVFDVKDNTEVDFPEQACSIRRIDWEPS